MQCPQCGHEDWKVLETRSSGSGIRRRRQCLQCGERFTTHERIEVHLPLVVKKDGRRVPFDRAKVLSGLRLACRKRPVSAQQLEDAASRVESEAVAWGGEIPSEEVGRLVLEELRRVDKVGFLRFASVYQEIESPDQFMALLEPWIEERE